MTRPPARTLALAAACAALLALPACARLPAPAAPPAAGPGGQAPLVVQPQQAARIAAAATGPLAAAADPATADLDALAARTTGPELDLRRAAATIAAAGATPPAAGADDLDALSSVLPRQEGWPRWFLTVTEPGADRKPSVVVLRSASAREPYRVWATPSLLPGASLPTTGAPADGAAVVAADEDANLPMSPRAAAERYADVLLRGDDSAFADQFAPDAYRAGVVGSTEQQTSALEGSGGSLTQERTPLPDPVLAVRTRDGGALVVAGYRSSVTASGPEGGRPGRLQEAAAALAGRTDVTSVTTVVEEVVVLALPPGRGPVSVVAVQSGPVEVRVP
ncbi:hypothetical protein [Kineococcus sp. SYSU DK005]|uniref:hypothetical protein n=1 Tax=Kineococcus sp. SYSU DK005 TaxID=3383126 RepID=UPI003D7D8B2E